jgi:carboxypeptidase family protein
MVTDETGAIVADATVKVTYLAKQLERQVTTNSDGHFILSHLPPSRYKWTTLTFEVR